MRAALILAATVALLSACDRISIPQSPLLKYTERKSGLIAMTDATGNLVVVDQGGTVITTLTTDGVMPSDEAPDGPFSYYQVPLWSPDGNRIAAVRYQGKAGEVEVARIDVVSSKGGPVTTVYTSTTGYPTVAGWSPDSKRLVFLATNESQSAFGFYLVSPDGGDPLLLDAGVPYGWAWSPRGQELVIHAGSVAGGLANDRLAFLDVEEDVLEEGLGLPTGIFGAPGWSADGRRILVAAWREDHNRVYVTNRARTEGAVVADVEGQLEVAFAPGDDRVAYLAQTEAGAGLYVADVPRLDGKLADPVSDGGAAPEAKLLSGEDIVAAFFWSPDGTRIAYFTPHLVEVGEGEEAGQALALSLKFVEVKRGSARDAGSFFPTPAFLGLVQSFGQYAQVLRIWSPDSKNVVYNALDQEGPGTMVARAAENIAPRRIAGGMGASWSRR